VTIVVGVDGSPVSQQALTWAIAEGRLRRETVRAVYAWDYTAAPTPLIPVSGPPADGMLDEVGGLQKVAERRLAEAVAKVGEGAPVDLQAVRGNPVDVLVKQSSDATLLVLGSRGHGTLSSVLLGSVSRACTHHAACPVVVIRDPAGVTAQSRTWDLDEAIAREKRQNAVTWDALAGLGVREGAELGLEFAYESGGPAADRVLAEFLRNETGYEVEVEPQGVTGETPPMPVSPAALDEWVERMVRAGHSHGGCLFDGWTATLSAGRV
jgi:nucleotide-binding universal stress UspA family protein